jgi:hypothetical protein
MHLQHACIIATTAKKNSKIFIIVKNYQRGRSKLKLTHASTGLNANMGGPEKHFTDTSASTKVLWNSSPPAYIPFMRMGSHALILSRLSPGNPFLL